MSRVDLRFSRILDSYIYTSYVLHKASQPIPIDSIYWHTIFSNYDSYSFRNINFLVPRGYWRHIIENVIYCWLTRLRSKTHRKARRTWGWRASSNVQNTPINWIQMLQLDQQQNSPHPNRRSMQFFTTHLGEISPHNARRGLRVREKTQNAIIIKFSFILLTMRINAKILLITNGERKRKRPIWF